MIIPRTHHTASTLLTHGQLYFIHTPQYPFSLSVSPPLDHFEANPRSGWTHPTGTASIGPGPRMLLRVCENI